VSKLNGDLELTTSLLAEQKNAQAGLTRRAGRAEDRCQELTEELTRVRVEKEVLEGASRDKERNLLQEVDRLTREREDVHRETERRIKEFTQIMQQDQQAKEAELRQLKDENRGLHQLIDRR
jgi:predicted  nucleic acid-binding Zn-ribbon protein